MCWSDYWAEKFMEYTDRTGSLAGMDIDFMLKTLDYVKVLRMGLCWRRSWMGRD